MKRICLPPVAGAAPKILILGSMPGAESLRKQQYYGHPRNQFWRLLGTAIGEDFETLDYAGRLALLEKRGVALWDVLASCVREGSLDADISDEEPNPVGKFVRETGVRAVFLNGGKADAAFRQFIADGLPGGVAVARLPSSSPAHAGLTFDEKLEAWRTIAPFLA